VICEIASLEEMMALAVGGAAIAVLPDYQVAEAVRAGELQILAPMTPGRPRPAHNTLFLAWRRGATESARLRAVRDALQASAPAVTA
jgi:DNA-binding transcriptional LysR family regulator